MAKTDQTKFYFNRKETGEAFNVSTQTIGLWELDPAPVPPSMAVGNRTYYDIREVIQLRLQKALGAANGGGDIAHANLRLARSKADKADLEFAKLKGELIPRDDIIKHWENLFLAFRAKILAIPQKAAHVALNATSLADVEDHIETFLIEALEELAGDGMPDEYKTSGQEIETGTEATSETNGKPVGRPVPKTKRGSKRGTGTVANK